MTTKIVETISWTEEHYIAFKKRDNIGLKYKHSN